MTDADISQTLTVSGGSVLDIAIRVEGSSRLGVAAADSHIEGIKGEVCVDAIRENVTNDLLCAKIFNNRTVEPALISRM